MLGTQRWLKLICALSLEEILKIQKKPYASSLVIWVIKKTVKVLTFFPSRIPDFSGMYRFRFSCPLSGNCRLVFCPLSLINLDFKFDLGHNAVLEIYKAELLDNINFVFFLTKYTSCCVEIKVHMALWERAPSLTACQWPLSTLPYSLCFQGSKGERTIFLQVLLIACEM